MCLPRGGRLRRRRQRRVRTWRDRLGLGPGMAAPEAGPRQSWALGKGPLMALPDLELLPRGDRPVATAVQGAENGALGVGGPWAPRPTAS